MECMGSPESLDSLTVTEIYIYTSNAEIDAQDRSCQECEK